MKNVHRLSLMVLTVLTAAFLVVDLPLMAQMGGQQRRGQQRAPQQQKDAQQGAPRGAGQAQVGQPPEPKLSPQQQQRVGQLRQQAQSLFRNLQQVLGELQQGPATQTNDIDPHDDGNWIAGKPNPQGPQQRPGAQPGKQGLGNREDGARISDDDPTGITNAGRNDAHYFRYNNLKQQAQQIVNKLEGIGKELKGLGFTRNNQTLTNTQDSLLPQQLQQMGKELEALGVAVPAASVFFVDIDSQMDR